MKDKRRKPAALFLLLLWLIAGAGCSLTSSRDDYESETVTIADDSQVSSSTLNSQSSDTEALHNSSMVTSENEQNPPVSSKAEEQTKATDISINVTALTLTVGESKKLAAAVKPGTANDKAQLWTSSDDKIASVDGSGTVTAHSEGSCTITVKLQSNPSVSADVLVTVQMKQQETSSTASNEENPSSNENSKPQVDSISVSFYEKVITVGESIMPQVTMKPDNAYDKSEVWTSSNKSVATVDKYGNITGHSEGTCIITVASAADKSVYADIWITVLPLTNEEQPAESEEPTDPEQSGGVTYINGILVVNKTYPLPRDYNPGGLTQECAAQFELLRQGASSDGINIYLSSGFRSYDTQQQLYNSYVSYYGQETADTFSARPGHSEHQTGLAIDCNTVSDSFIGTPEAIWLAEHCHEYGFIIRYPEGKEDITGYKYEPWHIRYVGTELAQYIYESGLTLEEYFNITSFY